MAVVPTLAMCALTYAARFPIKTTTRPRIAPEQIFACGRGFFSTITMTQPKQAFLLCMTCFGYYQEAVKALAQQIVAMGTGMLRCAATGITNALTQALAYNCTFISAIAAAMPQEPAAFIFARTGKNQPSSKSLSCQIYRLCGCGDILGLHKKFTFLLPSPGTLARRLGTFIVGLYYSTGVR